MKKTLIALAALATTSVFAQNVTLYGKFNMGIADNGAAGSRAAMTNGADGSSSRWGLKGSEDLGGGLKANFQYESGLRPDTGASDGTHFQRSAWGGLSGGFGEVRFGRQYTVSFFGTIGDMPETFASSQLAVGFGFGGQGARGDDQIQYWSPRFGGLQARVSTQLKGDAAAPITDIGLNYSAGPIGVNFVTAEASGGGARSMALNGSYNLGMAKVAVGYVDTDSAAGKGMFAMVTGSMGSLSPFIGFASNSETDTNAWDTGAFYALSKRTRVYGIIGGGNKTVPDRWSVGMDHNF